VGSSTSWIAMYRVRRWVPGWDRWRALWHGRTASSADETRGSGRVGAAWSMERWRLTTTALSDGPDRRVRNWLTGERRVFGGLWRRRWGARDSRARGAGTAASHDASVQHLEVLETYTISSLLDRSIKTQRLVKK
jgi:hypothetical protein